jgi:transglutaminase-like putative cysteine protease
MPILAVRHVTTYRYKQPVVFGDYRMMLRPRDDEDQKVLEAQLEITPGPRHLIWTQDFFGNHVATARFADRASELRFESTIRVEKAPASFRAADIMEFARTYPFTYAAEDSPAARTSSRRRQRTQCSIAGPLASSARMDRPTLTSFSWT